MKILITIFGFAFLAACTRYEPIKCPSEQVVRAPFIRKITEVAGSGAHECGFVSLHADASGSIACAREMLNANKPFFVAVQFQGDDSYIWEGVAKDKAGLLSYVFFDSDIMGSICKNPRLTVTHCASVELPDQKGQEFRCARID